jgi:hypothetical protein
MKDEAIVIAALDEAGAAEHRLTVDNYALSSVRCGSVLPFGKLWPIRELVPKCSFGLQ